METKGAEGKNAPMARRGRASILRARKNGGGGGGVGVGGGGRGGGGGGNWGGGVGGWGGGGGVGGGFGGGGPWGVPLHPLFFHSLSLSYPLDFTFYQKLL